MPITMPGSRSPAEQAAAPYTPPITPDEPGTWHKPGNPGEPAYTNGWSSPSGTFRFAKRNNTVRFTGNVVDGTANLQVFTLPVGFRPAQDSWFAVPVFTGVFAVAFILVPTTGIVTISVGGGGTQVFLDSITFPTD